MTYIYLISKKKKEKNLRNVNEETNTNLKKKKKFNIQYIFSIRIYESASSTILYLTDRNKGPFRIHLLFTQSNLI